MKHNIEKRLEALERQHHQPVEVKLIWPWEPHDPDDVIIKLRWLDEVNKEY
jgi:hypothetical protein